MLQNVLFQINADLFNLMFLEQRIIMISEDHVTLKTAVMMLKIHRNNYTLIEIQSSHLKYCTISLLYVGSNKC